MTSKPIQTRQAWTEKERDDICAQHSLHPDHNYQTIKEWFDNKYAPKTISKSQISKIINQKQPRAASSTIAVQQSKIQPTAARVRRAKCSELDNAVYEWC